MISPLAEKAVCRLLRLGLPHREVAARTGVSHGVVGAIASGDRSPKKSRRAAWRREGEAEQEPEVNAGPFERCPSCGAMVELPCVACNTNANAHRDRAANLAAAVADFDSQPIVSLELRPAHMRRYLEVRRGKVQSAEPPAAGFGCLDLLERVREGQ